MRCVADDERVESERRVLDGGLCHGDEEIESTVEFACEAVEWRASKGGPASAAAAAAERAHMGPRVLGRDQDRLDIGLVGNESTPTTT